MATLFDRDKVKKAALNNSSDNTTQAFVCGVRYAEELARQEMIDLLSYIGIETDGSLLDKYLEQR